MDNKEKRKKFESIFDLEEYFSVEDYSIYLMARTGIERTETKQLNPSMIRLWLMSQNEKNRSIEIIVQKADIEKMYEHIKIYGPNKKNFINIFINREEVNKNDIKGILNKINGKFFLKPVIINYLKIKEFPLINYSLEQQNNEGDIKTYILKENCEGNINPNPNSFSQGKDVYTLCQIQKWINWKNNMNNQNQNKNSNNNMDQSNCILPNNNNVLYNNNFQNYQINNCNINGNQIMNPKLFMNQNYNNNFNLKNNIHTNLRSAGKIPHLLNENNMNNDYKKNENNLLVYNNLNKDEKIKYLEKLLKEGKNKINELKEKLARYPFELLPGERMMSIIFSSLTQNVHYSVICKNTDIFVNVELKLYKDYPEYKKEDNFFTVNGRIISKYKSLEENGIKNSDVILINIKDTSISCNSSGMGPLFLSK